MNHLHSFLDWTVTVSESESEPEVIDLEQEVDLDSKLIDLTQNLESPPGAQ